MSTSSTDSPQPEQFLPHNNITMPSHLRLQSSIEPHTTQSFYPQKSSPLSPPAKKQKMSLTQTYYVASTARSKLGKEAGKPDHDLRLLVGHANLLDALMIELADAEREQEAWFHDTVRKANKSEAPRHVQWIDSIAEEMEEDSDDSDSDSDSDSDIYEEDVPVIAAPARRRSVSPPPAQYIISEEELSDEDEEDFEYDEDEELELTRVPSHHPPELIHEDSDSDDESMPPSPEQPSLELTEKQRQQAMATSAFFEKQAANQQPHLYQPELLITERNNGAMVAAY